MGGKILSIAWAGGWFTIIALTAATWLIPVPFQTSLLLGLGLANGWIAKGWLSRS